MRWKLIFAMVLGTVICSSTLSSPAWSQKAPKTCTEAYRACAGTSATVPKACDEQKRWCMSTGSFEEPKSKSLHLNLRKK